MLCGAIDIRSTPFTRRFSTPRPGEIVEDRFAADRESVGRCAGGRDGRDRGDDGLARAETLPEASIPPQKRGAYDDVKRSPGARDGVPPQASRGTCIARIFITYGPRMRLSTAAIPTLLRLKAIGSKSSMFFGDGPHPRRFCYVHDLVRGLNFLAMTAEYATVNLRGPDDITLLELAETVIRVSSSRTDILFEALPRISETLDA